MSDIKNKVKEGIDDAAAKTKSVAGKAIDKTKDAVRAGGDAVKEAGNKMKNAGK